ncbi:MAG: PEP-CTERM sorting domain-containing protein, partial [Myxococcota bacterium]
MGRSSPNPGGDLVGLEAFRWTSAGGITGTNPNGQTEAWLASVPEPGPGLLLLTGLLALAVRRRRRAYWVGLPAGLPSIATVPEPSASALLALAGGRTGAPT